MKEGSSCIAPRWKGAAAPPRAAVECSDSSDHPLVVRGPGVTTSPPVSSRHHSGPGFLTTNTNTTTTTCCYHKDCFTSLEDSSRGFCSRCYQHLSGEERGQDEVDDTLPVRRGPAVDIILRNFQLPCLTSLDFMGTR